MRIPTPSPWYSAAPFRRPLLFLAALLCPALSALALPEITVRYSGAGEISDAGTVDFGTLSVGASKTLNFIVRNDGDFPLTGISFTKNGAHSNDFQLSAPPGPSVLAAGSSLSFSITFSPGAALARTAAVHISSNDSNENPYDLNLKGIGVAPDISVAAGGLTLTDGTSTVSFGKVRVGFSGSKTVVIRNVGNSNLTNLSASTTGGAYTVTTPTVTSLAPGVSTTLTLRFTPSGTFTSTGTLRINSNDADESPFDVNLTGSGVIPVMEVESPLGIPVYDSADNLVLTSPVSVPLQRTFLIRNVSGGTLTGLALTIDGDGAANFSAGALPVTSLDPGATLTFTVTFTPPELGTTSAALHINYDQSPLTPFNIALTGEGVTLPDEGDEDGDGVSNMIEAAMGTDPLTAVPDPGILVKNGANLEFTITRSIAAQATYVLSVEYADDPAAVEWTTLDTSFAFLDADDGVRQTLRYVFPAGDSGHRFVRIRANRGTP